MNGNNSNVPVRSVERMLDLVEVLQDRDGATLTEIANELDIAKSTTHNHLRTLQLRGYVTERDGKFHVGLRFLDLGGYARERALRYRRVRSKVKELADETGELCSFVVEQEGKGIIIDQEQGEQAVETQSRVGTYEYLHAVPGGKAILASLDSNTVDDIIERHGLPSFTPETVTHPKSLRTELDAIAKQGYAVNAEEYLQSLYAISVPIGFVGGDVFGALTIVGPAYRLSTDAIKETIVDQLLGVSNELELNLTYSRH